MYMYIYTFMYTYVFIYIYKYMYMYVYKHIYTYIHTHINTYKYTYTVTFACIYVHTYTCISGAGVHAAKGCRVQEYTYTVPCGRVGMDAAHFLTTYMQLLTKAWCLWRGCAVSSFYKSLSQISFSGLSCMYIYIYIYIYVYINTYMYIHIYINMYIYIYIHIYIYIYLYINIHTCIHIHTFYTLDTVADELQTSCRRVADEGVVAVAAL